MIEEIVVAMAIGGGLGNSWVCALLSLGCSIEGKKSGIAFVGGRFLGLMILGAAIAGLGLISNLKPTYFLIVFGAFSIVLGGYALHQTLRKPSHDHEQRRPLLLRGRTHKAECKREVMANGGEACEELDSNPKTASFFALGVFRGATPCLKVAILAPLLISVDFGLAMVMVLAYAAVSTVYPVIGLLSGNLLRHTRKYAIHVRVAAALLIIALGIFFIINAFGGQGH
jgi:cytochrome c biogenesis protein CcdA